MKWVNNETEQVRIGFQLQFLICSLGSLNEDLC